MKNSFKILPIAVLLFLPGCEYLDEKPFDWAQPEDIFTAESDYERPINQAYAYIRGGFNRISGAFLDAATDDGMTTISGSSIHRISRAYITSASPVENSWTPSYAGIRQALFVQKNLREQNLVLNKKTEAEVEAIKAIYIGEMYALRALYEFDLLRHYGGYPIIEKYYTLGDPEFEQKARDSFEDCVNHIVTLCDSAAMLLEVDPIGGNGGFGRMTKGAALAIKEKHSFFQQVLYSISRETIIH